MAQLNILEFPDPAYAKKLARCASNFPNYQLIDDMLETMYAAPGIGLAATQIDVHKRIVVADVSESRDHPYALVNPTTQCLVDYNDEKKDAFRSRLF
ncbi:MAG: hypothetical protein CM1200mP9_00050 [Gammaproteobacteria bacterium]|nr:MAG: hypothetical protein CM1200mP9_00050 [Gammaproteobacteria bacterium]